jgi:hypothetical protein
MQEDAWAIPHPVLLGDLAELREFGVELSVRQSLEQLYRETWDIPAGIWTRRPPRSRFLSRTRSGRPGNAFGPATGPPSKNWEHERELMEMMRDADF